MNNITYELKKGNGNVIENNGIELEYEGEYLNGVKWNGKGKKYYKDGTLKYVG